ncbi:MAG: phosphate acyltransferase PlsX [Firmicutes bacterium]|jgi:glycerol-3-phosphate acyltransferase PlsX|nr:phosphate acyltransferase PlsX [Bacillota bacterium]
MVAVDAMGGDHAPEAPVRGAVEAARTMGIPVCLVGDGEKIRAVMDAMPDGAGRDARDLVTVRHASEVVAGDDQPVAAIRRKKDSSMAVALAMVRDGEASAVVSAGNTGALMAGGVLILGRVEGVDRPALSTILPTENGKGVLMLDVGANVDSKPEHLVQFAVMGSVYASRVLGWKPVSVALLNIGSEQGKGCETVREAFTRLRARGDFAGNVEAKDVLSGGVNVVVCDGFAGNVFLKTLEGAAEMIFKSLKKEIGKGYLSKLGALMLKPAFAGLKARLDYSEYGGAPLLGLKKACIKCHGRSGPRAIMNGCRVAFQYAGSGAIAFLEEELRPSSIPEGGS